MSTYSGWFVIQRGHPSKALQLRTGLPIPTKIPKGHVLVQVQAAALNPVGHKLIAIVPNFVLGGSHRVPEHDVAGIIVDANSSHFKTGDKVFGTSKYIGTLTEYAVLPSSCLATVPPNVSAVEAAGMGIVIATAYQGLVEQAHLKSGQTVFINGGSSGVGLSAVQLAKSMGCKVVATASAKNKDTLLGLGVDEFIDYTQAPLIEQLLAKPRSPKFDVILDAIGLADSGLYLKSKAYLAPGGTYLTVGVFPNTLAATQGALRQLSEGFLRPSWLGGVPQKCIWLSINFETKDMENVRDLVAKGAVKPMVDSVYTFDRDGVLKAYEKMMSNRAVGKVVVKVAEE
ncbi:NAD(P)-binding protein [Mycena alexandri]|uniref:NAD(P)-binding protein n=1 Tax=Mycena alexandri TaxID=1745969 RepID=A0AAD6T7C5_9AGAR|nr:NAD(P)-binding protein [Mycena alexandri]